jgi:hypothetical protein
MDEKIAAGLRAPFEPALIGKRPQITCRKCSQSPSKVCEDHRKGRCDECSQWITGAHTHLDFVGHADITDRFLKVDSDWSWEPVERDVNPQILAAALATGNPEIVKMVLDSAPPKFDANGGMWMRLTIGGVTRLGYGDAAGKTGPNAIKEAIGDGLRNAGMRFGAGLDMWRKEVPENEPEPQNPRVEQQTDHAWLTQIETRIADSSDERSLQAVAREIDHKRQLGKCEDVHYDHLWSLGEQRYKEIAAGANPSQPAPPAPATMAEDASAAPPESAAAPASGSLVEQYEQRLGKAVTAVALAVLKAEVMADFKAQKFNPTDGNKLLRAIRGREYDLQEPAA